MQARRWLDIFRLRLLSLFRRGRVERDLNRELRAHLEHQTAENIAAGMTREEARLAALREFGGLPQIEEDCRDMRRTNYIESFVQDLRYAARTLARNPSFAVVIVLTLGLAIGANSAIFSVIEGVLLRPLPYASPDRLVRMFTANQHFPKFRVNPFDFRDVRERNRSFEKLAAFCRKDVQLSGIDRPERLTGLLVTAGFFETLGYRPALGREFDEGDEHSGSGRVVILSDRIWKRVFAGDPGIVGRKIILDAMPLTVVGVMPPGVQHVGQGHDTLAHGDVVDVWRPFVFTGDPSQRGSHFMDVFGRLRAGVSIEQAVAELNSLYVQLGNEHPSFAGWHTLAIPMQKEIVGKSERLLLVLLGAVGFVLLIACVNAANLMLAQATSRQREIAVRAAIGAGRRRIIRQALTESLLISALGGILGAVLSVGGVRALVSFLPAGFPRVQAIHLDLPVFGFTLLIALGAGFLFGLAPSIQASKTDLIQSLREGGRSGGGHHAMRLRSVLVVAEVSLASVLLIGAGLMLRSFLNLVHTDPGFRPEHVISASVSLPGREYKTGEDIARFCAQFLERVGRLDGVQSAGFGTDLPWTGYNENTNFHIEGTSSAADDNNHARYHAATADYFRAVGIPLVKGRFFTEQDRDNAANVLIVNETFARRYWPNADAVGKRLTFTNSPKEKDWFAVVGVVRDVKDAPSDVGAPPSFWWSYLQQQPTNTLFLAMRANSDPVALVQYARRELGQLNAGLALADVRSMDQVVDASLATPKFALFLVALFAGLAIVLAAIGTYGVMAYSVSRQQRENGIRIALGARPGAVLRLVLMQGLKLAVVGVVLGIAFAVALGRVLGRLLYGVSAGEPLTFAWVAGAALVVAGVACYLPARRATRADPMAALRAE